MTKPWISDGPQRRSARYTAILRDLAGIEPAGHLTRLTPLPAFQISYSSDTDKITRHRIKSQGFREHGE